MGTRGIFLKQVSDLLVVCISDAPRMIINQFLLPFDSIDSNTVFFTNAMLGILGTVLLGKRCKKRSKLAQRSLAYYQQKKRGKKEKLIYATLETAENV